MRRGFLTTEAHRGEAQRRTEVFAVGPLRQVPAMFIDPTPRLIWLAEAIQFVSGH